MPRNPFTYGNPISEPARFFGRDREIEQIITRLRNKEFESSSLVGDRRIGKTSLLNFINHAEVRHRYGLDDSTCIFVYVDLQLLGATATPTQLWHHLLRELEKSCRDLDAKSVIQSIYTTDPLDMFTVNEAFEAVEESGRRVVFLLDEFDQVTANPLFGPDFFLGLRSLSIHHKLALITASRNELIELCHSQDIRSSPFFNIFANINLSLFPVPDARRLMSETVVSTNAEFTPSDQEFLIELAGPHPFFLQMACHFLFDAYSVNEDDRRSFVSKSFAAEAAAHLSDCWRHCDDHERIVLTASSLLESQGQVGRRKFRMDDLRAAFSRSEHVVKRLEKRGLLVSVDDGHALFCSALGAWIIAELKAALEEEHSYGAWLKSNEPLVRRISGRARRELADLLPKVAVKYRDLIISWLSDPEHVASAVILLKRTLVG
jgi:hypothetical protein